MGAIFLLLWILLLANVIVRVLSFSGEVQCPSLFLCVLRGSCVGKPVAAVPWVQVIVGGSGFWDQPTQAYSAGTESASNAGDPSWIPGSGRSPGGGHGNPLKYSCLENPMDMGSQRVRHNWTCQACGNLLLFPLVINKYLLESVIKLLNSRFLIKFSVIYVLWT